MTAARESSADGSSDPLPTSDPSRRAPGRRQHDVVFYTPWIGSILSSHGLLPPGGAETQILMLSRSLARCGLAVAIVAYGDRAELPAEVDGVTVIARPLPSRHGLVGKLIEVARIWRSLSRARGARIVYRAAGAELAILAAYARLTRRRLIHATANVVDFDAGQVLRKRRDLVLYEYGVRHAHTVVVQTEEQIALCRKKFGSPPRMIKSISPLAPASSDRPEAFLWVGRLVSYKRPLDYLALARAVPEARFWMVGVPPKDPFHREVADTVAAEAAEIPNLELLAPRPHAEIELLMGRAVASVNTADYEGMPNVLLEAWCRGVPALVLRHDPDGVITRYGLGGFADGSSARFAELARELWLHRDDRTAVSERCRSYIANHHSPDTVVGQWVSVLFGDASAPEPSVPSPESVCAA